MMGKLLIRNIKSLIQVEDKPAKWVAGMAMDSLQTVEDAFLFI